MAAGYDREFVSFTEVHLEDRFWAPRLSTNRSVTIPHAFRACEETGTIANFEKAAGMRDGPYEGLRHADSDVYKVIEGAAYALATAKDPELERYVDALIVTIAAAQESDGYLYTCRTIDPNSLPDKAGPQRWSLLERSHELYDLGHLYEAGVAYFEATGKRGLLDVGIKSAELLLAVFGPKGRRDPPGHQEIEIGLVKLFRATGDERWLQLARFFLEERGRAHGRDLYGPARQDHLPVVEQTEAVGHAVRVGYMCAAMADVAALTPDTGYDNALQTLWRDVTSRKLSLTGGVGASREGEAFSEAYALPNRTTYNETCAAIGIILWNQRMFLSHGDAAYMDVIETTIYNGFLAGVGLSGDRFFYTNPLESDGTSAFNVGTNDRQPWYSTPCCPTNVVRFLGQMPGLFYAVRGDEILVNLYAASTARLEVEGQPIKITQVTDYPWSGSIRVQIDVDQDTDLTLSLRIPRWTTSRPLPGGLYEHLKTHNETTEVAGVGLAVNGNPVAVAPEAAYVSVERTWSRGDEITLELALAARLVKCDDRVEENRGKVALMRGPIVYCFEEADNGADVRMKRIGSNANLTAEWSDELGGLVVVRSSELTGIPYYAWSHRGPGQMAVWLPHDTWPPRTHT